MPAETPVAVIGSPSDCTTAVLNLLADSFQKPLLGKMLQFSCVFDDGSVELALGTVTRIQTVNAEHAPTGRLASHIALGRDTGSASSDTRGVSVKVEAVFRNDPNDAAVWHRHSSSLSNSPKTGTPVYELDQATANALMSEEERPAFLGPLRGSPVQIPHTHRDFSGARGSYHSAVFGLSGSGKTVLHAYRMANDLRWTGKGHLVLDPQGQFAMEHGLPFSLQGLATACGRKVTVARLSQSLRLRKDAPLFLVLLTESGFFRSLAFGAGAEENIGSARRIMESALRDKRRLNDACGTDDWTEADPSKVLTYLLEVLYDVLPTGTIYAGREQSERVQRTIRRPTIDSDGLAMDESIMNRIPPGALDQGGEESFSALLATFGTLHSLWSPYSPSGWRKLQHGSAKSDLADSDLRRDLWGLIRDVLAPPADQPAPWLILDLSADMTHFSGLAGSGNDDDREADAARLLDHTDVKARIMKQILNTLELVGQQEFSRGRSLNVQVDVDEAHRWEGTPDPKTSSPAMVELSSTFARLHREVRKYGIGFASILQVMSGLSDEIFSQVSALFVGYGLLDSAELKKLSNRIPDSHVDLYKATPPPEATGRYTWMLVGGGITGLSMGFNPVTIEVFNDANDWLTANEQWITDLRRQFSHLLPSGDTGGKLRTLPRRPDLADSAVAAQDSVRSKFDSKGNATAVAAAARTPRSKSRTQASASSTVWSTAQGEPPF